MTRYSKYYCWLCNKSSSQKSHSDHHLRTRKHKQELTIYKLTLQSEGLSEQSINELLKHIVIRRGRKKRVTRRNI